MSVVVTGDNATPCKYGVTMYVKGPVPTEGGSHRNIMEPIAQGRQLTPPGSTKVPFATAAFAASQGHPISTNVVPSQRRNSIICP